MPTLLSLVAVLLIAVALIGMMRRPLTLDARLWTAAQFLGAAILFWLSYLPMRNAAGLVQPQLDRSAVIAHFSSISIEGPQRRLTFHYVLENATDRAFRIDADACSVVSFRFTKQNQAEFMPEAHPNPALHLLESDRRAYAKFTGLERLPTTNLALSLDQCPLELQPKQKYEVAIAIPYAYPAASQNPREDNLKMYVRAFMPQIDGFGISDLARNYEIDFPRGW